MQLTEIKELALDEIADGLKKSRIELADLRMKFASRQLENPSLIKKKRKEIAWLLTVETQKIKEGAVKPKSESVQKSKKKKKSTETLLKKEGAKKAK